MADPNVPIDDLEEVVTTADRIPPRPMGFNIGDFRSSIRSKGILRTHSFMAVINLPLFMNISAYDPADLTLRCESTNLPSRSIETYDGILRYGYGAPERMAYGAIFNDLVVTFIVDKSASQFRFFNDWMDMIYNTNTQNGIFSPSPLDGSMPFQVEYKERYATTVNLFLYNEDTNKVMEMVFHEVFPTLLHDTNVSWEDNNNIVRLAVTLSYRNYFTRTFDMPLDSSSDNGLLQNIVGGLIGGAASQIGSDIGDKLNAFKNRIF